MFGYGAITWYSYSDLYSETTLYSERPITYWKYLSFYQMGTWGLGWSAWLINTLFGNDGTKVHLAYVRASQLTSILPIFIYPVFMGLIWFGYSDTTSGTEITREDDDLFLPMFMALVLIWVDNFWVTVTTYIKIFFHYLDENARLFDQTCLTEEGEEIDCLKQMRQEIAAEQAENGGSSVKTVKNETNLSDIQWGECGDYFCPESWFTYLEFRLASFYL